MKLEDDFKLLNIMLNDVVKQPSLYGPGPYWAAKTRNAVNEIKRCGLAGFRGSTNLIALSYADNLFIDGRNLYNHDLKRIAMWVTKNIYPLNKMFQSQVYWTESYAKQAIVYAQEILNLKERIRILLKKYTVPYSLLGNCLAKVTIEGNEYAIHYLNLLEQHDNIASRIDFQNVYSIFEIGGGFGANAHLLLENYKNIKKVLYLDIAPNLYVGTQYLKAFYGKAVVDYQSVKYLDSIKFSQNDNLQIFCITPWQIEKIQSPVDLFMNSNSFVEMPAKVIRNYIEKFNGFPNSKRAAVALMTYDQYDLNTTLHPDELPKFFKDRNFEYFEVDTLLNSQRKNFYFVSRGI